MQWLVSQVSNTAGLRVLMDDSKLFCGDKPFVLTNLKPDEGLDELVDWIRHGVLMQDLAD